MGRLPRFGFRSDLFDGGVTSGEVCVWTKKGQDQESMIERENGQSCARNHLAIEAMFTQQVRYVFMRRRLLELEKHCFVPHSK